MSDFWARRKAAVEAEAQEAQALHIQEQRQSEQDRLDALSDTEVLAELDLPDPETLGEGDDFTVFLREGIPARLKTRALRRLWRVNPVLANLDGLVDYGEDFTDAATVVENLQTAYQVGKGMLKHVEALARQAEAKEAEVIAQDETLPVQEDVTEADPEPAETDVATVPAAQTPAFVTSSSSEAQHAERAGLEDEDTLPPPSRRRMTFTFQDAPA